MERLALVLVVLLVASSTAAAPKGKPTPKPAPTPTPAPTAAPGPAHPYDQSYFGATWMSPMASVRQHLRGAPLDEKKALSPWDLPHVREVGHLYFIEDREFARLRSSEPAAAGGETVSEYYFFRNQFAMVKVLFQEKDVNYHPLVESLEREYAKVHKEASFGPEETYVEHRFESPSVIIIVTYNPRRVDRGFTCENLQMLVISREYIRQVTVFHDSLKAKYGKE